MTFKNSILLIIVTFLCACNNSDDDNCVSDQIVLVTSIEATSTTGVVNEPVNIDVNFSVNNGCGAFKRFIETKNNNVVTIEVEARYSGCICTHIMMDLTSTYTFVTEQPGDYVLRFKSGPESAIIMNVTIN